MSWKADPRQEEAAHLYETGATAKELSSKLGVSKGTIYEWLKKYNVPVRHPKAAQSPCIDCDLLAFARGYCKKHYTEHRRDGHFGRSTEELREMEVNTHLLKTFNITLDQYNHLLYETQGGACPLCDEKAPSFHDMKPRWPVDHDHACCPAGTSCGRCIRGILCNRCNPSFLEHMNLDWLHNAIGYIEKAGGGT